MNSRELFEAALNRQNTDVNPFWAGHPSDEAKTKYYKELGLSTHVRSSVEINNAESSVLLATGTGADEIVFDKKIGSDMIWLSPELDMRSWVHPEGKQMWDCFDDERKSLTQPGRFAECESIKEIEAFDWPDPKYLDLTTTEEDIRQAYDAGMAIFGGMWCPFFHVVCDFFGMENYFIKMYTEPELVHCVTEHVVDFYLKANDMVLSRMAPYLSAGFFGNDLGSQLDLLISPECFHTFIEPYLKRIVDGIHKHGLRVAMHSCGAIDRIIPSLIDAGVEVLHPLQAKARGMDAEHLAREYGKDLIFMGGVDTQELLPFGSAQQVSDEVHRLRKIFGSNYIVSPSHEALLPNVSFENLMAMAKAAKE